MNLNFLALRALQAFVEDGSIARAAVRIHRTEPQVSRLLGGLQSAMGFPILHKQGRKLVLTPQGQEFYAQVARLMQVAAEVQGFNLEHREPSPGHVHVLTAPHTAQGLLVDALARAAHVDPAFGARVELRQAPEIAGLMAQHRFDVAFTELPVASAWVQVRELVIGQAVMVMHADHPLARRAEVSVDDLGAHDLVSLPLGHQLRRKFEECREGKGETSAPRFEASTSPLAAELAASGVGVALADPFAALALAQQGAAIRKFTPSITLHYGVVLPADKPASAATELLVETLYDLAHQRLQSLMLRL